jgi:hypothetical protein
MTAPATVAETQVPLDADPGAASAVPAPKPEEIKLEGDLIPENLRGKTVADALTEANRLKEALRISEEARQNTQRQFDLAIRAPAPAAPPPPAPEVEYTEEQLAEMHSTDPIKFTTYLTQRAIRQAERNLEARLGPLFQGTANATEATARTKYATEFKLFGDQIESIISQLPGGKAQMANPQAWDDLIALVRGRPGNFEKVMQHNSDAALAAQLASAQEAERLRSAHTVPSVVRGGAPSSPAQLDATQLEIADKLGLSPQEYVTWSKY